MRNLSFFLFMLCLAPAAFAAELRGDWESAGDVPAPYEPKYDFEYDCQMELMGKRPLVAATRFTLRNKETSFETGKKTRWEWVKVERHGESTNAVKDSELQLDGYYVALRLRPPQEETGKDRVNLSLGWKLNWKDVEFSGSQYSFEFTREDSLLIGRFFLYAKKAKSNETRKSVVAQLYCDKVK